MKIEEMKNIGPKMALWLEEIGITDYRQLQGADPFEVYAQLKMRFPQTSLNALYALIGAVEERDWREVMQQDKTWILHHLQVLGLAPKKTGAKG